ncbi:Core-2/I-Branching enzyme [seawater metagenome]|uniref:Core-2/I-Branching enzyme n=1 Tax=seawater metagenome TaxID=1561972 RepID=A0A5E8CJR1_9ZZZZ
MKDFIKFILCLALILFILHKIDEKRCKNKKKELFDNNQKQKLAFCFLTVNDINQPKIWNKFFDIDNSYYNIYMHPKNADNVKSFMKDYIIPKYVETAWGNISLTDATFLMLKEAYKDPNNKKMILVSDSCIPLKKLENIYKILLENDNSWFNYYKPSTYVNSHYDRIQKLDPTIKNSSFIQEQWMVLDRNHVKLIIENYIKLRYHFLKPKLIPDEILFITLLFHLNPNMKNELQFPEHTRYEFKSHRFITFADWYYKGRLVNSFHPITFDKVDEEVLNKLKKVNTLFARKFSNSSDIHKYWDNLVK